MTEPESLGKLLQTIRTRRELSVRQLAQIAGGIHPSAITRIENGLREPTLASLEAFARGLDLTFTITGDGMQLKEN